MFKIFELKPNLFMARNKIENTLTKPDRVTLLQNLYFLK